MEGWIGDQKAKQKPEYRVLLKDDDKMDEDMDGDGDGDEDEDEEGEDEEGEDEEGGDDDEDGDDEDGDEENGDEENKEDGSDGDRPPAKRMRMSRLSVDARIAQAGGDLVLPGLTQGVLTRSLSRSSCASSVASC